MRIYINQIETSRLKFGERCTVPAVGKIISILFINAYLIDNPNTSCRSNPFSSVNVAIEKVDWFVSSKIATNNDLDDSKTFPTRSTNFGCHQRIRTGQIVQVSDNLFKSKC